MSETVKPEPWFMTENALSTTSRETIPIYINSCGLCMGNPDGFLLHLV
jgi:hypothetical protein